MTHRQAIAVLLQAIVNGKDAAVPSAAARREAAEHVARCSDCWNVLAVLGATEGGAAPADLERMRELYGCEEIRDELWQLEGLAPDEIRERFPHIVSHLWWCDGCRERYLEIAAVAAEAAAGEYGPPVFTSAPAWKNVVSAAGRTVRELVGSAVVAIEGTIASFTRVPDGVLLVPVAAAVRGAGPMRGPEPRAARRMRVELSDSPLAVEITIAMRRARLIDATVLVSGPGADGMSIEVGPAGVPPERARPERQATHVGRPVTFRDLPEGDYLFDVQRDADATIQRIALSIRLVS